MSDSWWLKVKRAQHHMVDIRREARRYAHSHPYRTEAIRQPRRYDSIQRYKLVITEDPDPMIAVILGDFVHNLRSALDHIIVAASRPRAKRKNAGFPISTDDLWARDAKRRYIVRDAERRKSFKRAISGLPDEAQAIVVQAQPYQRPHVAQNAILAIIGRLENADKHRELITVGTGLENPLMTITTPSETIIRAPSDIGPNQFLRDGAQINLKMPVPVTTNPEVDMKFSGTAAVSIKIAQGGRNVPPREFQLYRTMRSSMATVRFLIRKFEPFVVR